MNRDCLENIAGWFLRMEWGEAKVELAKEERTFDPASDLGSDELYVRVLACGRLSHRFLPFWSSQ